MRPIKLDQGVLSVEVDDPAWATQVKFLTATIIARLAEVAGAQVDRIQVRVDPRAARGARMLQFNSPCPSSRRQRRRIE